MAVSLLSTQVTRYFYKDSLTSPPATPLTFAGWFNLVTITSAQALISFGNVGADTNVWEVGIDATSHIYAFTSSGAANGTATTSTTVSAINTWFHACGVISANNSRAAYLNGGGKGTETTSSTPSSPARLIVGCRADSTASRKIDGRAAQVAYWNVALDDAEVAALGKGFDPRLIRPTGLISYYPVFRTDWTTTTLVDRWKSGNILGPSGGTDSTYVDQPPIIAIAGAAPGGAHA